MKPLLLFVHGWGFDSSVWDQVRAHFAPEDTLAWDLGFFGTPAYPAPPAGRPLITVGHSFGALWLLHHRPVRSLGLVAINGFSCFTQRQNFPHGVAPRLLERMQARLATKPTEVVTDFRTLCGVTAPLPAVPDAAKLAEGLTALREWDERPINVTAALCGTADMLVTQAMSRACFPEDKLQWCDGGHMLPLTSPEYCARHLRAVLDIAS